MSLTQHADRMHPAEMLGHGEYVFRSGVVVELSGLCEAQALAGQVAVDLLGGKALDVTGLLARVISRRLRCGEFRQREYQERQSDLPVHFTSAFAEMWPVFAPAFARMSNVHGVA